MNTSGEAADQVVRMSLEVGEAALKVSGEGAKQLAVLLFAILKEQKKTKGKARLETLVRSGKPLTVFSVREGDLKEFTKEAKHYGILYCAIRDPGGSKDGMVDVIVKEEDAPRINRIVERFQFASVNEIAKVKTEIEKSREENAQPAPEKDRPGKSKEDILMDELFGEPVKKEERAANPSTAKTEKSHPSEPTSEKRGKTAEGTSKPYKPSTPEKPSVRKELQKIKEAQKKEAEAKKRDEPAKGARPGSNRTTAHKQPKAKKRTEKER